MSLSIMENDTPIEIVSPSLKIDKDDIRAKRHYLRTSVRDGKEVKIWECGLCGKEFKFQYTLVRHIPTHTDVRNYQCSMCPKAFRQLSTLAQHKVTHLNLRPFVCEYCCKSFNRISTLISHKKIHYDIKRHVCSFCGKGFHQKGNLRNHMYTHTNERPYKCDVCHKGFNQKSNLVCHKLSTHFKKTYHCEICKLHFTKEVSYNSHISGIHNMKILKSEASADSSSMQPGVDGGRRRKYILKFPVVQDNICNNNNEGESGPSGVSSIKIETKSGIFLKGSELPTITPISMNCENETKFSQFGLMNSQLSLRNHSKVLKNQMAVVYTKTQPNVRVLKPRVNVPSHENTFDDCCLLHAKCLECSSKALTVDGSAFLSGSKPSPSTPQQLVRMTLFGETGVGTFPVKSSDHPSTIFPSIATLPSLESFAPSTPAENRENVVRKFDLDTCDLGSSTSPENLINGCSNSGFQHSARNQGDPLNNSISDLFEIKTESLNNAPYQASTQDAVHEIEPSLFNAANSLKDNFKFGLDFESNFDFLEEAFGSGLLDNVNMASSSAEALTSSYSQVKFEDPMSFIDL